MGVTSCTPVGVVSQGAKRGGNEGVKGVQSEGEWEWESVNIIAAMKKQPTHIMYILILMTEVCVIGCNSHLHTLQCNTRSCICVYAQHVHHTS